MTAHATTQKASEAARQVADDMLSAASDAVESTRSMANQSLDKADSRLRHLHQEVDPLIDGIAAKAQDFANRGITYCAHTGERARRQFSQAADTTARYVADKPGTSLLIAAAAGAALAAAMLLARRGSRDRN